MTLKQAFAPSVPVSPGFFRGPAAPGREGLDATRTLPGFPLFRRCAAAPTAAPPSGWVIPLRRPVLDCIPPLIAAG